MKKLLFIGFVLLLGCISAYAVPAKPGVKRIVTLADGTKVELTLRGDEHYKFYQGSDGFAYREKKKSFERISLAEAQKQWKKRAAHANTARRSKTRSFDEPTTYTGKRKGLVILMQFKDVSFVTENALDVYKDFFNKEGYADNGFTGSVSDYFKAQSYGQFELDFDVVGPFTAKDSMAYYGTNLYDDDGNDLGDAHAAELAYEGCLMADSLVNFADYDWDGDGLVDQVFIVYAGYAEAQGAAPETIWPHEWVLEGEGYNNVFLDGVRINTYACSSELAGASGTHLDGIGTACHEFSHCLGFPDFYDTDYSGGNGTSYWDIMCSGGYNNDSRTPAGYTSYERWYAGWLTPKEIKGDVQTISNMKPLVDEPEAYILYNDANRNEYYLLENRQLKGFDAGLCGHGLLVLHVDYDKDAWISNTPNDDPAHQRCVVIPADNNSDENSVTDLAGDPFPGITGNTSLTNFTTPAATLYNENIDGQKFMSKAINDITESEDGLISFEALGKQTPLDIPSPDDGEAVGDENSFTVSWPAVDGAMGYQVELTELGKVPSNVADALEYEFDFKEFVSDSVAMVNPDSLDAYGLAGWLGDDIYTSPNKMLLLGNNNYLISPWWNMPKSTELTVVIGAGQVDESEPATGLLYFASGDEDDDELIEDYQYFTPAEDGKFVFHLSTRKDYYYLAMVAYPQMYLNYLAVYNGTWSEQDLGIADANAQGNTRAVTSTIYETDTNSITFTELSKDCNYRYRVRAVNEKNVCSPWSAEKVFSFGATGILNVVHDNNTASPQTIYSLQGRSMGTNPSALPKGIYIINGKKVVK